MPSITTPKYYRTGYTIGRTQCETKMQGPLFQIMKDFKVCSQSIRASAGPLWVQGPVPSTGHTQEPNIADTQ